MLIHTCRQAVTVVVAAGAIAAFGALGEGIAQASKKWGEELRTYEGGDGGGGGGVPGGLPGARERDRAPPATQPGEQRPDEPIFKRSICGPGTSDPDCELWKKLQNN